MERLPTRAGREVGPSAACAVDDLELDDPVAVRLVPPNSLGAYKCPLPVYVHVVGSW